MKPLFTHRYPDWLKIIFKRLRRLLQKNSIPSHWEKVVEVKKFRKKYGLTVFVETGTYQGAMIKAVNGLFKNIISIELGKELFEKAKQNFSQDNHIDIRHGDSGTLLPSIISQLDAPALFWLDGHYSGGSTSKGKLNTPIRQEIQAILSSPIKHHVILIDDARCFNGQNDYPTIKEIRSWLNGTNYRLRVAWDIIRITPNN